MVFHVSTVEGCQVIAIPDDVTGDHGMELAAAIKQQLEANHKIIVLDFTKAAIIDSMGISGIVANVSLLKTKGGKLILAGCNPTIKKVFQLVGFERHFPIVETIANAVKLSK